MNIKQIIEKHLKEIGADGLIHPKGRCECLLGRHAGLIDCVMHHCANCVPARLVDGKMVKMESPEA